MVKETKGTKRAKKDTSEETKADQSANTSEETKVDEPTVYTRATPFGDEVWDPTTKSTTMKSHV